MAGQHLYIIQSQTTGAIKVGRSDHPDIRLRQIQTGSPYKLRLILVAPNYGKEEPLIHKALISFRTRHTSGEWFKEESLGTIPDHIWVFVDPWYHEHPDWWRT